MNHKHQRIHSEAIRLTKILKAAERDMVEIFIAAEESKLYLQFDKPSLYLYGVEVLGLSESVAYNFMSVAKTAMRVPQLRAAIVSDRLTPAKAGRITAHVEQHEHLIEFAASHSKRETEIEVARLNPEARPVDKVRFLSTDQVQITVTVTKEAFEALKRTQSLLAQRDRPCNLSDTVNESAIQYVVRKDPVHVAERNLKDFCPGRIGELNAAEVHAVNRRDRGRCQHVDSSGKMCGQERWTEIHHVHERSKGGTNDPHNLVTLCGFHHKQRHKH